MKYVIVMLTEHSAGYYHPKDDKEFCDMIDILERRQGYSVMEIHSKTELEVDYKIAVLGKKEVD